MPTKPAPLVVEVVYNDDPDSAHAAQIDAIKLLIKYVLEDRGAEIPDSLAEAIEA